MRRVLFLKGFKMVHMLSVNVGRGAAVRLEYCDWKGFPSTVRAFLQP